MVTGAVMAGSSLARAMVCGPAPGMAKAMVSAPAVAFAEAMAARREPAPLSAAVVTVNVAADRGSAKTSAAARRAFRTIEFGNLSLPRL